MNDSLLMTFVKNPILGTAKTRLAASVGDEKALEIYKFLLQYSDMSVTRYQMHL